MQIDFNFETKSRHPPLKPPPKKKKKHAGDWSQFTTVSFIPAHPLRCGKAGSPCLSRCRCATVRQCANSLSAAQSAASRTGRQCVSGTERISTLPRDFGDSRSGWTERRGKQGAPLNGVKSLRFVNCVLLPIKGDSSITIRSVIWSMIVLF